MSMPPFTILLVSKRIKPLISITIAADSASESAGIAMKIFRIAAPRTTKIPTKRKPPRKQRKRRLLTKKRLRRRRSDEKRKQRKKSGSRPLGEFLAKP